MANEKSLPDRMIQLEELYSHQQHTIQQMDEVIIQLRGELSRLRISCEKQQSQIDSLMESQSSDIPNEKPPHY